MVIEFARTIIMLEKKIHRLLKDFPLVAEYQLLRRPRFMESPMYVDEK